MAATGDQDNLPVQAAADGPELRAHEVGSEVWLPEALQPGGRGGSGWARGRVAALLPGQYGETGGVVRVDAEDGWSADVPARNCHLVNERDDTLDDLVKSDYLHEAGILQTLRVRYGLDMIYTYSSNILIAVNPHKRLRHLYGGRMMAQYRDVQQGQLTPHVYAIAEQAFSNMMIDEQRQAILISGESGAGKTESAKTVMQFLASRARKDTGMQQDSEAVKQGRRFASMSDTSMVAPIEEQVLESNPLLEAFGNAKTSRNDNSSRFGKFVELRFDVAGRICGAFIRTYLLERSRVVRVNPQERSYHIFYMLCGGAPPELRAKLGLEGGAQAFRYLDSEVYTLADVDEAEALRNTQDAMSIVGLPPWEQESILSVVAAVLHLGNVQFGNNSNDEAVVADPKSQAELETAARLLQVAPEALVRALTTRTVSLMHESILKVMDARAATESRDALAKTLYSNLFDWLVSAINRKIPSYGDPDAVERVIGILDIYGFESFAVNSFEQLCINLANERLQQHFNQHIFKGEQEEYVREGIKWSYVDFVDNQGTLDLLEGTGPGPAGALGVFPLIDEANRMGNRSSPEGLAHTVRKQLAGRPGFTAPRHPQSAFGISHYAGQVVYSTDQLLDKNKDFVVAEHAALVRGSQSPFVQQLLVEDAEPAGAAARGQRSAFKLNSVGAQFRTQLKGLMATLNECQPHYVRCIKPNTAGVAGKWETGMVLEQLRAGGVLEAVRIACAGFPTRKAIRPFAQRYKLLLRGAGVGRVIADMEDEAVVEVIRLVLAQARLQGWQIGTTRVFLRAGQLAALETARSHRVTELITRLQASLRGWLQRRAYKRKQAAAIVVQAAWRGHMGRQRAEAVRQQRAAVIIQKNWRRTSAVKAYKHAILNKRATVIQKYVRMFVQLRKFRRETEMGRRRAAQAAVDAETRAAAVVLQKYRRRVIATRKLAAKRTEAKRWHTLQTERDALAAERDALRAEVSNWKSKRATEAARADAADAANATLLAELESAQVQLKNMVPRDEAREAAEVGAARQEVEAAAAAASAALAAELQVARRGRADAEAREAQLQAQVAELQGSHQAIRTSANALVLKSRAKEAANAKLWEQVQAAAQEYQREFAAKDATITALSAEVESLQDLLHNQLHDARDAAQDEVKGLQEGMARRLAALEAQVDAKVAELTAASTQNVQLGARLASMSRRSMQLEGKLRETAEREAHIRAQMQGTGQNGGSVSRFSTTKRLSDDGVMGALASSPVRGQAAAAVAELPVDQQQRLSLLIAGVIQRRLQIVNIVWGPRPSDAVGMHVAAWVLGESLMHWASEWQPHEVQAAATRLLHEVAAVAQRDGLVAQSYWLATTLALGAFLKVRGVGKRGSTAYLFKLGDELINFTALHKLLATSVPEMMPVVVTDLLITSQPGLDKKRDPRRNSGDRDGREALSFENLMNSPWKGLLGGLSNVIEVMRGEGAPPTAVRAVVAGGLCYLDAELLNALVLRRDCCSVSAVKALQAGLAVVKAWLGHIGRTWCGGPADIASCLVHSQQAVSYLLSGKDEVARMAERGADSGEVVAHVRASAPRLSLQQLYKLTEHHHDDWAERAGGDKGTLGLLRVLQAAVQAEGPPPPSTGAEDDEEELLLDSRAAFLAGLREGKLLTEAARHFVQAPRGPNGAPGVSLLQRIDTCCRRMALPRQLRGRAEFEFLL
eukprot:CAMPEP_0206143610 /NCGR_PEP_ID=MMETSP1473-20131121/21153_1 /ASSEMBLY_ACC=CAM_ASM_001109 /TAXON_ID=1461547 /ORGANISM="Stichococcus sp, Strain RCC1054" /LENGTH=1690 /DNA_ID=CAMNT_0053539093 /DNA_START=726 /DNA_END=5798 /DNA_ORIENTATION=+